MRTLILDLAVIVLAMVAAVELSAIACALTPGCH